MHKKEYKLNKILKYREMQEKELKNLLNELFLSLKNEKEELKKLEIKDEEIRNEISNKQNNNFNLLEIKEKYSYLMTLAELSVIKKRKIYILEEEIKNIKEVLIEKNKSKKIIERLIDKIKITNKKEINIKEQKSIDDINILKHSLKFIVGK